MLRTLKITLAAVLAASPCLAAHAAPISAADVLRQFNLVVFEDAVSYSHVDGRAYVGGNLVGGDYVQHPGDTPVSTYAGLTVMGNASRLNVNGGGIAVGGSLSSANINSGSAYVAGDASNVNFNGGPAYVGGAATGTNFNGGRVAAPATGMPGIDVEASLRELALQLSGLSGTGSTVSLNGNRASFNAVAGSDGVAVFDLTSIDTLLFGMGEFEFNLNGADLVVFNVDDLSITSWANFLGGSAQAIGGRAIWNFYNATDVVLYSQFGGAVLAPEAHLTNYNNIEGTAVSRQLTQYGEIHLQPLQGTLPPADPPVSVLPEPGVLALLALAMGALLVLGTRGGANRGKRPAFGLAPQGS